MAAGKRTLRVALGRYRLVEDLGERRLGRLYAGRDERDGKSVAVVEVGRDRRAVVERARVAVGNAHENAVAVVDASGAFIVLESLVGRDLRDVMRSLGKREALKPALAAHIASSAASALSWAHARGVTHESLDLDDVFILGDAGVKVLGLFCASPTPMALALDDNDDAAVADVRALGEMLFRMLTGGSPYASVITRGPAAKDLSPFALSPQAEVALSRMPPGLGEICRVALSGTLLSLDVEHALGALVPQLAGADDIATALFSFARRSAPADVAPVAASRALVVPAPVIRRTTSSRLDASAEGGAVVERTGGSTRPSGADVRDLREAPTPPARVGARRAFVDDSGAVTGQKKTFPPPLRAAAVHRVERDDVTALLPEDDAADLAELVDRYRHDAVWWIEEGEAGKSRGAVTLDEIHRRAQGGRVSARSLVWCNGMKRWRELRHLDVAGGLRFFAEYSLADRALDLAARTNRGDLSDFADFGDNSGSGGDDSLPNIIWDYQIVRRLGDGGQGTVYLARDVTNGYDVALKSIPLDSEGARSRFEREVRAVIGTQGHPHITQLHRWRIDRAQRRGYLAFSYIPGRALAQIISTEGKSGLDIDRCVDLVEHIALGLAKLHEREFIHRDLKPQNVMVRADPGHETAVLIDLGIAKVYNVSSTSTNMGSPFYAAPERFRASSAVDHRSDLYSLGLILFEMLTGRPAFPALDLLELALAHVQKPPPDPGELRVDVPAALAALTLRLLAKDPADRPDSAMVVVERLREVRRLRWAVKEPKRGRVISAVTRLFSRPGSVHLSADD